MNGYDYYRDLFPEIKEVTDEEWFTMLNKEAEKDTSCAVMRAYVKALDECGFQWKEKE